MATQRRSGLKRRSGNYWIAAREGMPLGRFCAVLQDEITEEHGEIANFASFLRVTCIHYLRHKDTYLSQLAESKKVVMS